MHFLVQNPKFPIRFPQAYTLSISSFQPTGGTVQKVINPQPILLDRIKQGQSTDYTYSIVNRARLRAEWAVHEAAETEKAAKAAETERQAYAAIDWHDFVVVETIKFTEADERANLPHRFPKPS